MHQFKPTERLPWKPVFCARKRAVCGTVRAYHSLVMSECLIRDESLPAFYLNGHLKTIQHQTNFSDPFHFLCLPGGIRRMWKIKQAFLYLMSDNKSAVMCALKIIFQYFSHCTLGIQPLKKEMAYFRKTKCILNEQNSS